MPTSSGPVGKEVALKSCQEKRSRFWKRTWSIKRGRVSQVEIMMTFEKWMEEVIKARTLPVDVQTEISIRSDDMFGEEQEEE